jgi:sensor histidine kinase YesM
MEKFLKNFPRNAVLSIVIFIVILVINLLSGNKFHFDFDLLIGFGYTALYTFSLATANGFVFDYLDKVFGDERFSAKRLVIGFLGSFIISLFVVFLLRILQEVLINKKTFQQYLDNESPDYYLTSIIITLFVTLSLYAFHFYKSYQENKVKEQKIIAGTASAKFESLKNQIDPHFLFNSLNVLSSLIEENPDNAQRFTTSLSKIYRYVLEQKDKELVTVEEELAFAKTYMNLLKMRFENSISYELPEGFDNLEAKVVPLSLQLLLENTIKHNVVSEQKPLHIKIFIKDNYLVVQNDLQKKEVLQDGRGVGLQNIISRYSILTERKVLIEQTENIFAVYLPILTKQVSIFKETKSMEANAYIRAKKRVTELKAFYANLISYCCVIPFLIFINLRFSPGFHWFWFSTLGWGFGLTMHAFKAYGYGSNWEERKIREIMEKDKNKQKWN